MFLTCELNRSKFHGLWTIIARPTLPPDGTLKDGFFAGASNFEHYEEAHFTRAITEILRNQSVEWVLVSKNSNLIFDSALMERVSLIFTYLQSVADQITLVSAGGLGPRLEHHCALYSYRNPFIKFNPYPSPIIDTMTDLYIVSATDVREFLRCTAADLDEAFELAIIHFGYAIKRKASIFSPGLAAGVNGHFRDRDFFLLSAQIQKLANPITSDKTLQTLDGEIDAPYRPVLDEIGRPTPSKIPLLAQAVEDTLGALNNDAGISIVTRTQFKRTYLLRRLLTSISRSRVETFPVEVVLSTDIEKDLAERHLDLLKLEFPHLILRLAVNRRAEHSRVANLIGGAEAASGEYIWFMDDDDCVDLAAFALIKQVLVWGSRPFIVGDCVVYNESWDITNEAFPVLAESVIKNKYPGTNWPKLFAGVNQLPICGAVIPRKFLIDTIGRFKFSHDLSEDYTLFLLLLSSESLPPVVSLSSVIANISVRENSDNTVTAEDRKGWTRDIVNYLYDLLYNERSKVSACWPTLFSLSGNTQAPVYSERELRDRNEMEKLSLKIRNLQKENDYLRRTLDERIN